MRHIGYKKSPEDRNKLIIDDRAAPIVKRIFEMAAKGISPLQITYKLDIENVPVPSEIIGNKHTRLNEYKRDGWKYAVILRMLENEVYLGHMQQFKKFKPDYKRKKVIDVDKKDWIIKKNTHEAIISEDTFKLANEMIANRRSVRTKTKEWLLKGIVQCAECKKKLSILSSKNKSGKITEYLRCNTYATSPLSRRCTPHTNNLDKFTDIVIDTIKNRCRKYLKENELYNIVEENKTKLNKLKEDKESEIKNISNQLYLIDNKIIKIYDDKLESIITENDYMNIYKVYNDQRKHLKERLDILKNQKIDNNKMIDFSKLINEFISVNEITKPMLYLLVDRIEVSQNKEIKIFYKVNVLN